MTKTWRYRDAALLVLGAGLIAANWYLQPGRARSWLLMAALIAVMAVVLIVAARRRDRPKWRDASDALNDGVFFAGVMLIATLTMALAKSTGLLVDDSGGRRMTMAVLGVFFMATGNALPKRLTPLATMTCDPSRIQSFQRFTGWTWVLTGAAYSLAWLVLPLHYAGPASMLALSGGMLVVFSRLVLLYLKPRSA